MALTEAQLEKRRSGIGGSDASKIMYGDHKDWKALYDEKVNGIRPVFGDRQQLLMDLGSAIEPVGLDWFNKLYHPLRKLPDEHMVHWKVDPFFFCTPDGITTDGTGVQLKFHTGDKSIMDLADYYAPQCLHEMLCFGTRKHYLLVVFGHYGRMQHIEIDMDDEALTAYLQRAMEFKLYMKTGKLPEAMAAAAEGINIPRRRDHVWLPGDNEVGPIAKAVLESAAAATKFEENLAALKELVPDDAQTATWLNEEGYGIQIKVARNNAKRWFPVTPKPAAADQQALTFQPKAQRLKKKLSADG